MSNLNSVVNVSIQLQTGAALGESFDYICLVGPLPATWSAWAASTGYTVGQMVYNGTHVYRCKVAGTSAASGGPTATSGDIIDGITDVEQSLTPVTWNYVQEIPPEVGVYTSLVSVGDAGWSTTGANADPIGMAAAVAFSQNPKPDKIYIAYQKWTGEQLEDVDGIGSQVTLDPGFRGDDGGVFPKLFGQDGLNFLKHIHTIDALSSRA